MERCNTTLQEGIGEKGMGVRRLSPTDGTIVQTCSSISNILVKAEKRLHCRVTNEQVMSA